MIDRVGEEVFPNGFVGVAVVFLWGVFFRENSAVSFLGIALDIEVGDEAAGVLVRRFVLFDIHDRAELVHAKQLP